MLPPDTVNCAVKIVSDCCEMLVMVMVMRSPLVMMKMQFPN